MGVKTSNGHCAIGNHSASAPLFGQTKPNLFVSHHSSPPPHRTPFHRDWRFIVAVVLMFGAMLIYVLTIDEAVVPEVPVATPPAAGATQ